MAHPMFAANAAALAPDQMIIDAMADVPAPIAPAAAPAAAPAPLFVPAPFHPATTAPAATDLARRQKKTAEKRAKLLAKRAKYAAKIKEEAVVEKKLTEVLTTAAITLYRDGHVDESVLALAYIVSGHGNALYKEDDGAVSVLHAERIRGGPDFVTQIIRLKDRVCTTKVAVYAPGGTRWRTRTTDPVKADFTLARPEPGSKQRRTEVAHYVKYTEKTARLALSEAVDRAHSYKTRVINAVATHLRTADIPEMIIAMAGGCPMSLWDRVPTKRRSSGDTTEEDE
jgi:hypothetical protein